MKTVTARLSLLLCLLAGVFSSCSEDFEVGAPYKPVTIVYGLLNAGESVNYIRIQKAFYDENRSALDLTSIADSNFNKSLVVRLKEINNGVVLAEEILPRVDLRNENLPKDSGLFFRDTSFAYKISRTLNPDYRYRLILTNTATGDVDSAETPVINPAFRVNQFPSFGVFVMTFTAVNEASLFELSFGVPANAETFEGVVRFRYAEKNVNTGAQVDKFIDWRFASGNRIEGQTALKLSIRQSEFQRFMRNSLPANPDVYRYIDTGEVYVWAGGTDLANYILVTGSQGGLTADQLRPIYTNIKGNYAYGIFSTRAYRSYNRATISDETLDSLQNGVLTKALNFRGRSDH